MLVKGCGRHVTILNKYMKKFDINATGLTFRPDVHDDYVITDLIRKGAYLKKIKLSKNDVWLDGGSNIGVFAYQIANHVARVVCIEPAADNMAFTKKNTDQFDNVAYELALLVGDDRKEAKFYLGKTPMSYSEKIKRGRAEIKVKCVNINGMIEKYGVTSLKLDIEGSEYDVIKAITDENWKRIDQIICEYHFNILKDIETKTMYNELINLLKSKFSQHNYKPDTKGAWHTEFYFSNTSEGHSEPQNGREGH